MTDQVARTSRAATLTVEAARASADRTGQSVTAYGRQGSACYPPLAFLCERILAGMKIGAWRITPGSASSDQTSSNESR